jgi:hypothetical protein
MSASAVLTRLKAAGVQIAVADGQLKLKGPKAVLSEDVLSELRAIKAELIEILSAAEPKPDAAAIIAEWHAAIIAMHSDLPHFKKLKAESLRFLDGPDAITAVKNGWDAVSLFGLHRGSAPKERIDCWGLVLFMAWGIHGCTVETIGQKVCALRTRTGAVQTKPRVHPNAGQAIPWWKHSALADGGRP